MGLDMYLYKKSWVKSGGWVKPEVVEEIKMTRGGKEVDTSNIRYIVEEIGYWRKANAIHKWFVDNVQKGEDDCGEYVVTYERLMELKELCERVLALLHAGEYNLAAAELPTQPGFFFGNTEYDMDYEDDLIRTINILSRLTEEDRLNTLTYTSSW